MAKYSAGRSIVDLRKKKAGSKPQAQRSLPFSIAGRSRRREGLRVKRRRARIWGALFALCCIAIILFILHALSFLPRYNIQTIEVQDAMRTSATDIIASAFADIESRANPFFSARNVLLYQPSRVRDALLSQYPALGSVSVARSSPLSNTLVVSVVERTSYARWCLPPAGAGVAQADAPDHRCYDMDEQGLIFSVASGSHATSYIFSGDVASNTDDLIGRRFAEGHMEGLSLFLDSLASEHFVPLGAHVENDRDFTVPLQNSYYLKASFGEQAQTLVKNLQLILSSDELRDKHEKIEYIDLRFGDRVYYKLKGD